MKSNDLVYVAGHNGMVGSAIVRELEKQCFQNLLLKSHAELDLSDQSQTRKLFRDYQPDYVFLAAARVGGIMANLRFPAEFVYQNVMISANVIHESYISGVKKLLYLGSSCIYPKFAKQPLQEDSLLTGILEPTNEPYALSKIIGIKMCDSYRRQYGSDFISAMPTNLYGPHDNYNLETAHVLPALMRKIHEAKINDIETAAIWGTGKPKREFLYVDDLAEALIFLMDKYSGENHINVGTGVDISISELAKLLSQVIGYDGEFVFDSSKPDGTPQKLLDISKMKELGWKSKTTLEEGIRVTYQWFINNLDQSS